MTAGVILLNVGAVVGIWGILWRLWDNRAVGPGGLIGFGIAALIAGIVLT